MEKYFVASNSSDGFCSYYGNAFDIRKFSRIYAIKGGSGTGKAFFMRRVAERAEEMGYSVRYIYCSSDAQSLDGIIIDELKIAVLDGTAPHVYEPSLLGAADAIVDLGAFLSNDTLRKQRREIEELLLAKKRCFESAYGYLGAYRLLSNNMKKLVAPCVKLDKMEGYVKRYCQNLKRGSGEVENRLARSIGMRGLSHFDTYFESSAIYCEVHDCFEVAHILLDLIYRALNEKKVDMYISNNPIIKDRLDAILLREGGLCFEISDEFHGGARKINMKRFVDLSALSSVKNEYRSILHVRQSVLELALSEFAKIKDYHFALEDIYGAAMDFEAKEKFTEDFCNKIL